MTWTVTASLQFKAKSTLEDAMGQAHTIADTIEAGFSDNVQVVLGEDYEMHEE